MATNRVATLAVSLMLLVSAPHLLAQHGGHGGGGRRGTPGTGGDTSDAGLTDFNRALAVQATADQAAHFQELLKNTENAKKLTQEWAAAKPDSATYSSRKSAALKDAVEEAQGGSQDFMKSFSKSQKAGLKELTKKLERADVEVAKQWKELEQQLATKGGAEGIASTADRLEKALEELQSQQVGLGKEMGVQTPVT
jgi:hypothetical protein